VGFFGTETLTFFRALRRHNQRTWFEAHRDDYEQHVREPMRAFIAEMDRRLAGFAPEIVADPKRSMFRIHRDIRFSKDKSPYKTHASCWFFHGEARRQVGQEAEGGSAGFYVQIAPGESFVGGGLWMPPRATLARLRQELGPNLESFERTVTEPKLRRRFGGLASEAMLKRMLRGYTEEHPAARWLRYQSFTMGRSLRDSQVTSARFPALLQADMELLTPLVRWLNLALDLPPIAKRLLARPER
jgi:uncharacterized protein (TIGR02453 family)